MPGTNSIFMSGAAIAAALVLAGPAQAGSTRDALKGAAIGAGGGAVVGAVVPGVSVGEGALIGGAGGAVIGALGKDGHRWYRDGQGRKYWIDKRGRRHYRR